MRIIFASPIGFVFYCRAQHAVIKPSVAAGISDQKKFSTAFVAIFMVLQLISGLNLGFFVTIKDKSLKVFANLLSFLPIIVVVTGSTFHIIRVYNWYINALLAYFLYAVIILRLTNYSMYNYLMDLKKIDDKWNLSVKYYSSSLYMFLFTLLNFVLRSTLFFLKVKLILPVHDFWIIFKLGAVNYLFFLTLNMNFVPLLMFHQFYLRINALKSAFEEKLIEVRDVTKIFKSMADVLENIRVSLDKIVSQ